MTIDELIELATEAREDLGGDAQIRIAYQPGYPLRAALGFVTIPYSTDPDELYGPDERHVPVARRRRPPRPGEPLRPRLGLARSVLHLTRATLTASTAKPPASSPWAAAGSRAPAARMRDDRASRPAARPAPQQTARPAAPQ
jgi:hypothetical protein